MTGDCLCGLVRLMEANPNAGSFSRRRKRPVWIRCMRAVTVRDPRVWATVYSRFALLATGESHYWGHNAIIRVKPFIEHAHWLRCRAKVPLPVQSCHMIRGSSVDAPCRLGGLDCLRSPGSYEELPPNLLDELKRDRRGATVT